ncbi:unnamed protein product [Camellia sinensis]
MASSLPNCPPFEFAAKYYSGTGDSCVRHSRFFGGKPVLIQGVWLEKRYVGSRHTSEWFSATHQNGSTLQAGMLKQDSPTSANLEYLYVHLTNGFKILISKWSFLVNASGATIQVLLFGLMAIEIKRKAPNAHTVCEIVKARWGTAAHLVFLTFCFLTNIIVMAMLLLGGSAVMNALTGVNIYAASFLIPLGIIVYTLAGGAKSHLLGKLHTFIYTLSSKLGSPSIVYHRLLEVASKSRVCQEPLTHNGYSGGLVFGIINIVGNFGTSFVDNGYWVSAISARPSSAHKGYLLGGLFWFAMLFFLATSHSYGELLLILCFLTNIIVMAMLLLGGSAVMNALTGGVHVVLVVFVYLVYTSSSKLGSPSIVYHRLLEVPSKSRVCQEPLTQSGQSCGPVSRNNKGSYLMMLSTGGLNFGIINIVGNFVPCLLTGYWLSAIVARPSSTHKGYLLGGLVWFAVLFSLATSLGLRALALDLPITASEASHGLVPPATAIALMGKGVFFSSLCTYDIHRTYINPDTTGKQILRVSRGVILGFGCFMGLLAVILNKARVSLDGSNAIGAILGTTIGCIFGIITWLSVVRVEYGRVNLDTTGRNAPTLAGNLVSILSCGAIHAVCSFLWPQNYDWDTTK